MTYRLVSENLTGLGQQGSSTSVNWTRYFDNMVKAKAAAVKDYGRVIEWTGPTAHNQTSGDLNYVMYDIKKVKVE